MSDNELENASAVDIVDRITELNPNDETMKKFKKGLLFLSSVVDAELQQEKKDELSSEL